MVSAPHPPLAHYCGQLRRRTLRHRDRGNVWLPPGRVRSRSWRTSRSWMRWWIWQVQPAAGQIHEGVPGNLAYDWELGEKADTEAALAQCCPHHQDRSQQQPAHSQRHGAAGGAWRVTIRQQSEHTLYTTSQNPHLERLILSAFVQVAPEHKLRSDRAGRRRRFRLEDLRLRGRDGRHLGGKEGGPTGEVDGGSERVVPRRCARTRSSDPRRARSGCGRSVRCP